jgi:hypothetical protein
MNKRNRVNGVIRPIKSKRDYEGASTVVRRLSGQTDRDSAAERRLQALLKELDRFDEEVEELSADGAEDYEYTGPRRRWSDDGSNDG